jgi:hypothetical protein
MDFLRSEGLAKRAAALLLGFVVLAAGAARMEAQGQGKLAAAPPVTYDNPFELYAGLNYMNFMAGPDLPKQMNLGGVEVSGTYWVTPKWGAVADFRGDAGTTFVKPQIYFNGRAIAVLYTGMVGVQYRLTKSQRIATDLHAYGGISHGDFSETITPAQGSGLYNNISKPIEAAGGSVDFNTSKKWAIRLSPDLILEQFGPGTREFFSISGGVVYRIGSRR